MFDKKAEYRVLVCGGRDYGKRWDEHLSEVVVDTQAVHKLHSVLGDIKVPENCSLVIVHGAARGTDSLPLIGHIANVLKICLFLLIGLVVVVVLTVIFKC